MAGLRVVTLPKRPRDCVVIYLSLVTVVVVLVRNRQTPAIQRLSSATAHGNDGQHRTTEIKRILYWTNASSSNLHGACSHRCRIESGVDLAHVQDYDAVVFKSGEWKATGLPASRNEHQVYVLYDDRLASNDTANHVPRGYFNWTMGHHWSSDVVLSYGSFRRLENDDASDVGVNYADGKTRLIASFNAHCSASEFNREFTVHDLATLMSVDLHNDCANLTCDETCQRTTAANYKFYLAFDNDVCLSRSPYISEKFYSVRRHGSIVPIVIDAHGQHARTSPFHSYIDALDFASVEHLADYLKQLDQNDTLYNRYLNWQQSYQITDGPVDSENFCRLCDALHDPLRAGRLAQVDDDTGNRADQDARCENSFDVSFRAVPTSGIVLQ